MRIFPQNSFKVAGDSRGFTIVELIMVVVLIGILAVSVVPKLLDTSAISLAGGAAMVAADIRYTQELAMSTHQNQSITFTPSATSYTVYSSSVDLPSNVRIDDDAPSVTFRFNSLGEPVEGGGSSVIIEFGEDGPSKTISVENYTGKVTIL